MESGRERVGHEAPYLVCAVYLVLLAIAGLGAALFMDNLTHVIEVAHVLSVLEVSDSWGIALLYLCCSGSFLGFAFAFGEVLGHNFAAAGESHAQASLHAAEIAFIGPLLGSLSVLVPPSAPSVAATAGVFYLPLATATAESAISSL